MRLITEGDVGVYYLQTLCMLFFPGAKFSQTEMITPETPVVYVKVSSDNTNVYAEAAVSIGEKSVIKYCSEELKDGVPPKTVSLNAASKALFEAASSFSGYVPPWGLLTGVRPTKLAFDRLNAGMTKEQTIKSLREDYSLYLKKAVIATDIARNEAKIIKRFSNTDCSVYISIPFCPSRCAYCSFVSYTTNKLLSLIPEYLKALKCELKLVSELIKERGMRVSTIYIGGGTPTTLDEGQLEELLSCIGETFDTSALAEYTLEAGRPDTITENKLISAKNHGITRISVNPQTLSDSILENVGRRHTVKDFYNAYELVVKSGIPHINTDLIIGLPGDDFNTYSSSLDGIIALEPDNITAHTFCAKRSADILQRGGDLFSRSYFELSKCVDYTQIITKKAGYLPYYMYRQKNAVGNFENVGFCKKGSEGIYNILMMEEVQTIFAVGAGAVTKLTDDMGERIKRVFNPKYPYEYLQQDRNAENERLRILTSEFFSGTQNGEPV